MVAGTWCICQRPWFLSLLAVGLLLCHTSARQLAQVSQSRPRTFNPKDRIVPEAGVDGRESQFAIPLPDLDRQFKVQENASWALDRLDQASMPLDTRYEFPNGGSSVSIYILDSGILSSHSEFQTLGQDGATMQQPRAEDVYTSPQVTSRHGQDDAIPDDNTASSFPGSKPADDCSGHGTHVASLAGGLTFGVAKKVKLKAIRVLACDGSASSSAMVEALEWLGTNAQRPAIAVVAVAQTGHIPSLEHAVERLVQGGVPVLTAAGNGDGNACDVSPASSPFAITVGATDAKDQRLQLPSGVGSNYGPCIDLFAPGQNIPGASANGTTSGVHLSGSSQAVALAAGAAAIHMHAKPQSTPAELRQALVSAAAAGVISENLPEEFIRVVVEASRSYSAAASEPESSDVGAAPPPSSAPPQAPLEGGAESAVTPPPPETKDTSAAPTSKSTDAPGSAAAPPEDDSGEGAAPDLSPTSGNKSSAGSPSNGDKDTPEPRERRDRDQQARRMLQNAEGPVAFSVERSEQNVLAAIPGAKRRLDYAPLLQIPGLGSAPLVATLPALLQLLPEQNSGLGSLYDVEIVLSKPAQSSLDVIVAEAATYDMKSEGDGDGEVAWGAPQRFGGPFHATVAKGDERLAMQLPLNYSLAMASSATTAFFLTVLVGGDDDSLPEKQIPLQVVDRKGWKATYPKVIMSTPYQDSMYTDGAGTELQNVLEHSPCVGSERERQSVEGLPGDDVAYFFKPSKACNAVLSLCGSEMSTEMIVLSHVDQADEEMAHFENCQISDQECLNGGALRVPMLADVGYLFVVRGHFGNTGLLKFRLECDNTAGQLPSWAGEDALLPAPLVALQKGILHSPVASNAPQVPISLGWSPCAVHSTPLSLSTLPHSNSSSNSSTSDVSAKRVRTTSTLALLPGNEAKWCPFCVHADSEAATCPTPPLATYADVISSDWSTCDSGCRGYTSARAQFCSVAVGCLPGATTQSDQLCRSTGATGSGLGSVRAPGAFHVLQSAHHCAVSEEVLQETRVNPCGDLAGVQNAQCDLSQRQWQEFGDCSKACGGGTREVRAMCVAPSGRFLEDSECSGAKPPKPQTTACNTHACTHTLWHADDWGACESTGVRLRSVRCMLVDDGGARTDVDDSQCESSVKPVETARCNTPDDTVFECISGDCYKGNCTQSGAYCECELGWHGERCDTRVDCPGLTSSRGDCCPNLRGADTLCCAAAQVLDRNGACCAPESLDVCRVCNGTSTALDLVGSCGTGALDAGGMLCEGRLDECGVCGGTGLSCDMHALVSAVMVYYPVTQHRLPLEQIHRQEVLETGVLNARKVLADELELPTSEVGLNVTAHAWQAAEAASGAVWVAPLTMTVKFAPLAIPTTHSRALNLHWLRGMLESVVARSALSLRDDEASVSEEAGAAVWQVDNATTEAAQQPGDTVTILIASVSALGREGVCGNGICEVGELLPIDATGAIGQRCAEDCPLQVIGCPQNDAGDVCSGHGACIHGTGLCSCDVGYSGEACDVCATSHFVKDGFCVTPLLSPRSQQTSSQPVSPLVIIVSVAALLTVGFVLALTCHAMYCGPGLSSLLCFCCLCSCCKTRGKKRAHGGPSARYPKDCISSSSGVGDELTDAEFRRSDRAATDSPSGSPTCFLIDPLRPDADSKDIESCYSRDYLSQTASRDLAVQHRLKNSNSTSFQTAPSPAPSPARKRNARARANAALATADADKTVSSVVTPDDISVKLPVDSSASKACTQSAALPGSLATPTKGGKLRWSEVQLESSAKLLQSTSPAVYKRRAQQSIGTSASHTSSHDSALKRNFRTPTEADSPQLRDTPGESCRALLNHWKRSHELGTGRKPPSIQDSDAAQSPQLSCTPNNHHHTRESHSQPVHHCHNATAAAQRGDSNSRSCSHPHSHPHSGPHPPFIPRSQSLTQPLPCSFPPTYPPPGGPSISQPVTYTSRSTSALHRIQSTHPTTSTSHISELTATTPPSMGESAGQRQTRPRLAAGWSMHGYADANTANRQGRSQAEVQRMGSSFFAKQPSNQGDSTMHASSTFWHASKLQSQTSGVSDVVQSEELNPQRNGHRSSGPDRMIQSSNSHPADSAMQNLAPFLPPESPPSLMPPSDLPSSALDGIDSSNELGDARSSSVPVRGAAAAAAAAAVASAGGTAGCVGTSTDAWSRRGRVEDDSVEAGGVLQGQCLSRDTSSEASMFSSSVPRHLSSTSQTDETSSEMARSSFSAPAPTSRHIYHRPSPSIRSNTGSRASSVNVPRTSDAMYASHSNAVSRVSSMNSHEISRVSRPASRASRYSVKSGRHNRSNHNSTVLRTSASSVLLWSHGVLPGEVSSPLASEEGDTFVSQRAASCGDYDMRAQGPHRFRRQASSQLSCSAASAGPSRQQPARVARVEPAYQPPMHPRPRHSDACTALTGTRPVIGASFSLAGSQLSSKVSQVASNTWDGDVAAAAAAAAPPSASSATTPTGCMHDRAKPCDPSNREEVPTRGPPQVFKNLALRSTGNNSAAPSPCMGHMHDNQATSSVPSSSMLSPCMHPMHQRTSSAASNTPLQPLASLLSSGRVTASASAFPEARSLDGGADVAWMKEKHASPGKENHPSRHVESGLENSSATSNIGPMPRGSLYSNSQIDQKGYDGTESTMNRGLSLYQSSQSPSELFGTTNFSAFESANPRDAPQLSMFGEGAEGTSTSGPALSADMSRRSTLRSKSSVSRMAMSREQLAWEHFGSVSDGGVAMPTIMTPKGSQATPVDSDTSPAYLRTSAVDSSPEPMTSPCSGASHEFGISSNLGTEISNLMQKVQKMQSRAAKGFSNSSQSSVDFTGFSITSLRSPGSHGGSGSGLEGTRPGGSSLIDRAGTAAGRSMLSEGVLSDSVELNFMHGMALWTQDDVENNMG